MADPRALWQDLPPSARRALKIRDWRQNTDGSIQFTTGNAAQRRTVILKTADDGTYTVRVCRVTATDVHTEASGEGIAPARLAADLQRLHTQAVVERLRSLSAGATR